MTRLAPHVDIIIPTRNRTDKLIRCLKSIERDVSGFSQEIIVVCDGDALTAIRLIRDEKVDRAIYVRKHSGSVYCRNLATQTAEDMILCAVDDMEFRPDTISNAVKAMKEHFPNGDGVIGLTMENKIRNKKKETSGFYAGVSLVGQKFLRRYPDRKLFFPEYFLFAAQEVTNLAVKLGKIRMCEEAKFVHHSPKKSGEGPDQTHLDGRIWKGVDRQLRKERSAEGLLWGEN